MYINRFIVGVFVAVLGSSPAWAVPVLSFDLDTTTPGIQGSRNVLLGDNFNVAVLLGGYDTTTQIDTVSFDVNYNSGAAVLAGMGGPKAGALVDIVTTQTWDNVALSSVDINEADPLSTSDLGVAPGYLANFGYFSYSSITDPFNLTGSNPITVALFNFTASALGTSSLFMATNPAALAFQGLPVEVSLGSGQINVVTVSAVPEPGILLLFGAGLIGLGVCRSRQRQ